jgi:uncharacterized protein involved in outer membrane biogenesis
MNRFHSFFRTTAPRHWLRRIALVLAVVLLVWGLGWLGMPPLIKAQLESRLGEQLGRRVTVGQVDFKPWSLELTLHNLAIAHAGSGVLAQGDTDSVQMSVKRLYIDATLQSLWQLAPVVDAITIDSPRVSLGYLGQGRYDVDDVLARLASRPADPVAAPLRFALYNLNLNDGALQFKDLALGRVQQLTQLRLSLPFLSNLESKRTVNVQPQLVFDLNGSRFDSSAQSTPFAQTRKTDAHLAVKALDLAPYLAYWPASLPGRLRSGVLDANLKLAFEQSARTAVTLSGLLTLSGVKLGSPNVVEKEHAEPDVLAFDQLSVVLKSVQPLAQVVQLGRIEVSQPFVSLQRDRAGVLNWQTLFKPREKPVAATKTKTLDADAAKTAAQIDPNSGAQAASNVWTLGADQVVLKGGQVLWTDDSLVPPARLRLTALDLQANALAWPVVQPVPFEGQVQIDAATLGFKGSATHLEADVNASLTDVPLSLIRPYLAQRLTPSLDGLLNAQGGLRWKAPAGAQAPAQLVVQLPGLTVDKLTLSAGSLAPLVGLKKLQLEGVGLDLERRTATLGRVRLNQPTASVTRAPDGRWMFEDWLKPSPLSAGTAADKNDAVPGNPSRAKGGQADPPWELLVNDLQLSDGAFGFEDRALVKPVSLELSAVSLGVKNYHSADDRSFGLSLGARVHHGNTEPGTLSWRGSARLNPLSADGDLTTERLPLHALEPYVSDALNVALLRADASFKGQVHLARPAAGLELRLQGDSRVLDLQVNSLAQAEKAGQPARTGEPLLSWKSLDLRGLGVSVAPGAATRVDVQETVLSDFYARLTLSEAGRFNLQDVMKPSAQADATASAATADAVGDFKDATQFVATNVDRTSTGSPIVATTALEPVIHVGPVSLVGGRVDFTDRFIKPSYSANLTELAGKLGAFASRAPGGEVQLAELDLRGRAEGSATLEVRGRINPLVQPLALDIKGRVRDLELAPLSSYAVRHAGYGIERGKLSMDVDYQVQPNGQLTANNNIVLNQLKFGDKVPDASASLPVKLAVALLADRNGVIDINLPVSGSLNDPQFRLLPIVFKILGNLIVKAITAPFSLLANVLGGGGEELSMVSFEPGSAQLSAPAKAMLDKVARALQDRPALKLTVVGTASLELERDDFKRAQLEALIAAEQRRSAVARSTVEVAGAQDPALETPAQVSPQAYPVLLKAVYKQADFPKPRNLVGLSKDLPVPEMEALLLAHLDASEAAVQALAVRRGVAVRDYLASLRLPTERLFLGSAKAVVPEAKWRPRAELNLASE